MVLIAIEALVVECLCLLEQILVAPDDPLPVERGSQVVVGVGILRIAGEGRLELLSGSIVLPGLEHLDAGGVLAVGDHSASRRGKAKRRQRDDDGEHRSFAVANRVFIVSGRRRCGARYSTRLFRHARNHLWARGGTDGA